MKLGFEESQSPFSSGSQSARAWTEAWVRAWAYCPHCGNARMSAFPNNSPLADFFCGSCSEEFDAEEPEGQVRHARGRRRIPDQVRAAGGEQQSEPVLDELRSE